MPYPAVSPMEDREEIDLRDLVRPLRSHRTLLLVSALIGALVGLVTAFLIPVQYSAKAVIMPPQQASSSLTSLLGSLGGLASLANKDVPGLKNPADLYVGILKSRTILDHLIERYSLQPYYKKRYMIDVRRAFSRDLDITAGKDGLISISVENHDAQRAADIANSFVSELYEANVRLALSEASQRRLFFEQQLAAEKNALAEAEVELKKTQQATGLIEVSQQADTIIRNVASLQAQIAAKEVQLQSLRSFATDENPDVIRVKQELAAMRSQLSTLRKNNGIREEGDISVPTGKIPELGLQYVRSLRNVKYHEQLFEILAKQYEAARIDEGKSAPVIQVVDSAIKPDKRSWPPRAIITAFFALLAFVICSLWLHIREGARRARLSDPLV